MKEVDWIICILGLISTHMTAEQKWLAPYLKISLNLIWLCMAIYYKTWGLIPLTLYKLFVWARASKKWRL